MCGIAGLISRTDLPVDREALKAMTALVSHRGPDGEGHFFSGPLGLGHRRLSIIDLSENGAQPMTCPRTGRVITYNGEVYNFLELRETLKADGYGFSSGSDTEVILAAYDRWGALCVSQFNGMWAFAIYDPKANTLFCSRDRFGVKPFYFTVSDKCFAFGSEIRQLLKFVPVVRANEKVLSDFIFSGAVEHSDATFFDSINKLAPGHNLTYSLDSNQFTVERYYELKHRDDLEDASIQDAAEMYSECLHDAVKLRLRSDVRVGTCLSGGLDSSSVATIASSLYAQKSIEPFTAITASSEDPRNDESEYAKQVVDRARLRWLKIRPSYEDFAATIDDVALAQEEPFGDPSICMQYFVMRAAHEAGIPVLLDGQGGDETMLGYERYFTAHFLDVWARKGFLQMLREMKAGARNNAKMHPKALIFYFLYFSSPRFRYWNYLRRNRYLAKRPAMPAHIVRYGNASRNIFALQKHEIEESNLPHLLRYEDKNSMWHSIETRLPFLDYRHVELALSLPGRTKIHDGWTKYLLRKVMSGLLPESIAWRRDKKGFEAPTELWLRKHKTIMKEAVLSSSILCGLSDPDELKRSFHNLDHQTRWRLYSVAIWERLFNVQSIPLT